MASTTALSHDRSNLNEIFYAAFFEKAIALQEHSKLNPIIHLWLPRSGLTGHDKTVFARNCVQHKAKPILQDSPMLRLILFGHYRTGLFMQFSTKQKLLYAEIVTSLFFSAVPSLVA